MTTKHIHCEKCGLSAYLIAELPRYKARVEIELYDCGEHLYKRFIAEVPDEDVGKTIIKYVEL